MMWGRVDRFASPEDGKKMVTEFKAPLPKLGEANNAIKMVDDWVVDKTGKQSRS